MENAHYNKEKEEAVKHDTFSAFDKKPLVEIANWEGPHTKDIYSKQQKIEHVKLYLVTTWRVS